MIDWAAAIEQIYWYWLIVAFLTGASIGSFLNVVIYRMPTKGLSIVKPRSFCPKCNTPIAAYDNIPLVSYLLLGGKCRHCKVGISIRYFLIELMTGLFALAFFHMSAKMGRFLPHEALIYFIFTCALIVITFVDLDLFIIPNEISLPGIPLGLAASFILPKTNIYSSLIGMAIGGGTLYLIGAVYKLITKREGMGFGDVKLMGMVGAFLGWKSVPFTFLVGSLVGTVIGIIMLRAAGKGRHAHIPFGPFLSLGAILFILVGPELIDWYADLLGG